MRQDVSKLRRWRGVSAIALALALALAITVVFIMGLIAPVQATFFPDVNIILEDNNSGVNSDMTTEFTIPKGDYMFDAAVVTYIPVEFGVARDEDVADGTEVGELSSKATLGIAAGAGTCATLLTPKFTLVDATTTGSAFTDSGDMIAGTWNGYDTVCAGGKERAVCQYPGFLDELYLTRPIARAYGHTVVTSGVEANINLLIFEPGADLGRGIPSDADWGYPSITQLNDNGVEPADPKPSSLADFCTRLESNNTFYGEAAGVALRTNPQYGGTYIFRTWARTLRDEDDDGLENALDTCPYDENDCDPRVSGCEGDLDGIDPACDPDDDVECYPGAEGFSGDCDADGYHNRADNCPMIQNGVNYLGQVIGADNQADSDDDGIGDQCDDNPNTPDGDYDEVTLETEVEIEGPAPPTEETPTATATATVVAVDTDGDTVADDVEELYGSDPQDADSTPENLQFDAATCSDGVDNDGDGLIDDDDPGCAVVEVTPTLTPTPTGEAEFCSPVFPGTYNGLVRIDGLPAASGYEVTASIDGVQWGSAIVSGGRYAMDIPDHLPTAQPCFEGGTITFALDGMTCTPTADWASGIHNVDLACAAAAPPVTTPTPAVTPTPPAVSPTPTVTPVVPPPTGAGGLAGSSSSGLPLWAVVLASWCGLMTVAGLGTLATRIVKR
jgi:hypothetical protein